MIRFHHILQLKMYNHMLMKMIICVGQTMKKFVDYMLADVVQNWMVVLTCGYELVCLGKLQIDNIDTIINYDN